jgi:uncharacterized protein YbcV (DUF1398 family)
MDRHTIVTKVIEQYQAGKLTFPELQEELLLAGLTPCGCMGCWEG